MRSLFLLFFLFLAVAASSQTHLEWLSYYGVQKQELSGTKPLAAVYDSTHHFVYVAGITNDTMGIATPGAHQQALYDAGGHLGLTTDVFLCKWDTLGNLIWGTYLGGEGTDIVTDLAIDNQGCVILFGNTTSALHISTPDAFQEAAVAAPDSDLPNNFLSKFSADGVLLWSTYYGAGNPGGYSGITVDPANNDIYLCASSYLPGLGTPGTFQPNFLVVHAMVSWLNSTISEAASGARI